MVVTLQYRFRPLPTWPHPVTPLSKRRGPSTFRVGFNDTLGLLEQELWYLRGANVVIGAGFQEGDIRLDGMPRANARPMVHSGVELSFDSKHGRLTYATDVCERWEHNLRSIALGLEALRAVNRYGVTRRGEQYAGWQQLTAGGPTVERGEVLVRAAGGIKQALMRHHPDHGGDPRDFADVQAYREQGGA